MDDRFAVHSPAQVNHAALPPAGQDPLARLVEGFLEEAWQQLEVDDFAALQRAATHLTACARVLGQGTIADMAALLAVAAEAWDGARCQRFVARIQQASRTSEA